MWGCSRQGVYRVVGLTGLGAQGVRGLSVIIMYSEMVPKWHDSTNPQPENP